MSAPKRVRYFLQHDSRAAGAVLNILLRAIETTLRRRSPQAPPEARTGAVSYLQRFGSSLNPHFHFHCCILDGVFAAGPQGEAIFFEATDLTQADIAEITEKVRRRSLAWLVRHQMLDQADTTEMLSWDHHGGFSLDASVRIEAHDRAGLERVLRYCARPPFALERLSRIDEQTLSYRVSSAGADGPSVLYMTPSELLDKLALLIPPPRLHRHHYWGILAPNARLRQKVIASAGPSAAISEQLRHASDQMKLQNADAATSQQDKRDSQARNSDKPPCSYAWAMLIARIYEALPLLCARCQSPMRIIAFITEPEAIARILTHIGEPSSPPAVAPARRSRQTEYDTGYGPAPPVPF